MSNPTKGEVGFDADGKRWTLVYSVNALCALEDKLGAGAMMVAEQMANSSNLRIATVRTLFWCGLRDHHPELTEADAGDIMTDIGITDAVDLVGKAFAAAFPADAGTARPLAAGRRAGKRS